MVHEKMFMADEMGRIWKETATINLRQISHYSLARLRKTTPKLIKDCWYTDRNLKPVPPKHVMLTSTQRSSVTTSICRSFSLSLSLSLSLSFVC